AADRVELLEGAGSEARDRAVEHRCFVDGQGEQGAKVRFVDLRELRSAGELPLELFDVVPRELPLIERLNEQLARPLPSAPSASTALHGVYCSRLRDNVAISIAVNAASAPLFPAFVPARSTACSIVSTVSSPKPIGMPCSSETRAIPLAASPAT